MAPRRAYLDYNATAPLRSEARVAMLAAMEAAGNPSSVHAEGRRARGLIEAARERVAALVGAEPSEVIFTSGATEAANTVLRRSWRSLFLARIEHPCIVGPALASEAKLNDLPVRGDGVIDVAAVRELLDRQGEALARAPGQGLMVAQLANNETGVIQPMGELSALARERGLALLVDAVQAAGRMAIDVRDLGADYVLVSSHKIGGPKGAGALVVREGGSGVSPLLIGGGQERRKRAGTENVEAIAGFGAAAAAALRERAAAMSGLAALRDRIEREVLAATEDAVIVGLDAPRLANTSCIALPGEKAETLVIKLDLAGVAVSAGAACSSGKVGQSPVLAAMGLGEQLSQGAIRVSLGHATTAEDVEQFVDTWRVAVGARESKGTLRRGASGASGATTVENTVR